MNTVWPVEELGQAALTHPGWCRRPHDGPHRSESFTVADRQIQASADQWWTVRVVESGDGPLTPGDAAHRAAILAYLYDPAGTGR